MKRQWYQESLPLECFPFSVSGVPSLSEVEMCYPNCFPIYTAYHTSMISLHLSKHGTLWEYGLVNLNWKYGQHTQTCLPPPYSVCKDTFSSIVQIDFINGGPCFYKYKRTIFLGLYLQTVRVPQNLQCLGKMFFYGMSTLNNLSLEHYWKCNSTIHRGPRKQSASTPAVTLASLNCRQYKDIWCSIDMFNTKLHFTAHLTIWT